MVGNFSGSESLILSDPFFESEAACIQAEPIPFVSSLFPLTSLFIEFIIMSASVYQKVFKPLPYSHVASKHLLIGAISL